MGILENTFDYCAGYIHGELKYFTVVLMNSFSCMPTPSFLLILGFLGDETELLMNLLLNSLIYTAENVLLVALQYKIIRIISESHFSPDLSSSHHLQSKIFFVYGSWSFSWKRDVTE